MKKPSAAALCMLTTCVLLLVQGCGSGPSSPSSPVPTVQVWDLSASASGGTGCPSNLRFGGTVTVSGTGSINYRWELWDGTQGSAQHLAARSNLGPNVRVVLNVEPYSVTVSTSGTYSARLHVVSPSDLVSVPATYTVICGG